MPIKFFSFELLYRRVAGAYVQRWITGVVSDSDAPSNQMQVNADDPNDGVG